MNHNIEVGTRQGALTTALWVERLGVRQESRQKGLVDIGVWSSDRLKLGNFLEIRGFRPPTALSLSLEQER